MGSPAGQLIVLQGFGLALGEKHFFIRTALVRGSADERSSFIDGVAYLVAPADAWQRTDFGRPQASIRFKIVTPIAASVC